jgi:hypothetical protein
MKKLICFFLCMMCLEAYAGPQVFSGKVSKGEVYEHALEGGLLFRLVPNSAGNPPGWVIMVTPKDRSRDDYVWVVTPPYRYWNPKYVDISYGMSAEEAVKMTPRDFYFVTNETDYKIADEAANVVLWPAPYTKKEIKEATDKLETVRKSKGTFVIQDSSLSTGTDGSQEIQSLDFKVELN